MSAKTTKTIKTTKTTNNCPVCGLEQDKEASDCIRCGWDFSPLLGTPDQVAALLRERLDQARTAWCQCRYNPELIPVLERDPFETPAEFAARVAERPWYVGECELRKAEYDIATGRFPLQLTTIQDWAKPGSQHHEHMYLRQSRDGARELYAQSAVWPVYARLAVSDGQVNLQGLEILRAGETLPVFSEGLPEPLPSVGSQTVSMPSILSADSGLRKLWLRLTLFGLGLIVILFLFRSPSTDPQAPPVAVPPPPPVAVSPPIKPSTLSMAPGGGSNVGTMSGKGDRASEIPTTPLEAPPLAESPSDKTNSLPPASGGRIGVESTAGKEDQKPDKTNTPVKSIPDRYRDLGDGTVMDVRTGLQWMRCALGQTWDKSTCVNDAKEFTWEAGLAAAKTLNTYGGYAGHQDWRVPTIDELKRLRYCKGKVGGLGIWLEDEEICQGEVGDYADPTIEIHAFPETPSSWFWSSSPYAGGAGYAWGVSFDNGNVDDYYEGFALYVRLVRGGQ